MLSEDTAIIHNKVNSDHIAFALAAPIHYRLMFEHQDVRQLCFIASAPP
ncbi:MULTISPECIES: hypothetical protein [unclassified Janthinobacterium]|nr:hypothetical protein [Janthinobacterium sp. CG_23.4]MDH6158735.1 hypothetical protein [Janthinobacterium sp. CG_23.4]